MHSDNVIHACCNYADDSWTAFRFIIKSHFQPMLDPTLLRQPALCHLNGHERANDATGASERLTVCWKNRPVNKATRPAELCQWLRGGGCDSKPQVNHAHTHTHTHTHTYIDTHIDTHTTHALSHSPPVSSSSFPLTHTHTHTHTSTLYIP